MEVNGGDFLSKKKIIIKNKKVCIFLNMTNTN